MLIEREPFGPKPKTRRGRFLLILAAGTAAILLASWALTSRDPAPAKVVRSVPAVPPEAPPAPLSPAEPAVVLVEKQVQKGESITSLLGEHLSPTEIHELAKVCKPVFPLRKIRAGRPYRIRLQDGAFQEFVYEIDDEERLILCREDEDLSARTEPIHYDVQTELVSGTIQSSLFLAVEEIGERPDLALRLAEIFAWDVDFVLDIRSGDSFRALVEKRYRKGEFAGYGQILAAQFVNQGKVSRGFLFPDASGRPEYYDEDGRNLRRAFLKAPLRFSRISSGYTKSRLHPVHRVRMPHPGVDYAAPTGTPVKAIGDGVITARTYNSANGNYVKIRHSGVYETYYLHLSRFGSGIRNGARVRQGQIIGYVGSTGVATGPHLDFRVKKNGQYVNPRTLEAPAAAPLPKDRLDAFRQAVAPLAAQLEGGPALARGDEPAVPPTP